MIALSNAELEVSLLDPADRSDVRHQGVRYCWGGYIWQVTDPKAGPLFTGAQWPEPNPKPFNGQGLPESFRHAEFGTNRPLILEQGRGFVIGVGEVAPDQEGRVAVTKPSEWAITRSPDAVEFCTQHAGNGFGCQLTRRVALSGRTLVSNTAITNTGAKPLPLHWFAHPFFALEDRLLTCTLPNTWGMAENVGYAMDATHRISFKRRFKDIDDGHFEQLRVDPKTPLQAVISHPKLSEITFTTDFVPDTCPIWGNDATWSIEPYIATDLAVGGSRAWSLRYQLGNAKG